MQNRISMLTLGVSDLNYMTNWYREIFGWKLTRKSRNNVLFQLDGLMLPLVTENQLAREYMQWEEDHGSRRFALTIGFGSKSEVDQKFLEIRKKGVVVDKGARVEFPGEFTKGLLAIPKEISGTWYTIRI